MITSTLGMETLGFTFWFFFFKSLKTHICVALDSHHLEIRDLTALLGMCQMGSKSGGFGGKYQFSFP